MPSATPATAAPLFGAVPGGMEMLLIFFVFLLVPVGLALWVYRDASGRGDEYALPWAVGTLLAGFAGIVGSVVVFVLYLVTRR